MEAITITPIDSVYVKLECERSIQMELSEYFTFDVPNAKYSPAYKQKIWDGKIRLFDRRYNRIYYGLVDEIKKFGEEREYEIIDNTPGNKEFSAKEAEDFIKSLNLPEQIKHREYQFDAFVKFIRERRMLMRAATNAGKSFSIYLAHRYITKNTDLKTLVVVPTTTLVSQMSQDFVDYGYEKEKVYGIMAGVDKDIPDGVEVVITTWQSIYKLDKKWFKQFKFIVGDEAHTFKAKSLTTLMSKTTTIEYKLGTTGSLDGTQTNKLVLEGLFGPLYVAVTNQEMIAKGYSSDLSLKCLVLKYDKSYAKYVKKLSYHEELEFLIGHEPRNKFITNLALSLKGNTLILYSRVEGHGQILYDMLKKQHEETYFVHGKVDTEERDEIRSMVSHGTNMKIVASYQTFSTGINAPELNHAIYASPFKGIIRNLQSIGRGLRKTDNKNIFELYDICDDLTLKDNKNYTFNHFIERMKHYNAEKFKFKIYNIELKGTLDGK
jgi:superfamily II DNA or RNA helicase